MTNLNQQDPELLAISKIMEALAGLSEEATPRVMQYVANKIGLIDRHLSSIPVTPEPTRSDSQIGTLSINTIAVRLGVKSCKDLMVAAAVHLTWFQGKERFSRVEWVECCREAKQWKSSYSVQTSTVINRLLSAGFVNETTKDIYVVPDEQLQNFESKLK